MTGLNSTAAAVLGELHEGPQTCPRLYDALRGGKYQSFFTFTYSQVYREMLTMADAGMVRLGNNHGPYTGQEYVITPAGKKGFAAWLRAGPGPDRRRSSLLLKLMYARSLSPTQRASLVEQALKICSDERALARTAKRAATDPYEKAIAEFALAQAQATLTLINTLIGLHRDESA